MIDHILWAVPELTRGSQDLARRCGATPQIGGRHPGVGTHNALLGLEDECYLEIIAPDPSQQSFSGLGRLLEHLEQPQLLTWCARSDDLEALAERARELDLEPSEITAMQRRRPDGSLLSWRLLFVQGHDLGGVVPFFIDWRDSRHPSRALDADCRLESLTLGHPDGQTLRRQLDVLLDTQDGRLAVVTTSVASLSARLATPRGNVVLNSH